MPNDNIQVIRDGLNPDLKASVSNGVLHTGIFDWNGNQADVFENTLAVGDLFHKLIHDGGLFYVLDKRTSVAQGQVSNILFRVGTDGGATDSGLHFRLDLAIEGGMDIEFYPVTSYTTPGSLATPRNFNGNCDYLVNAGSPLVKSMYTQIYSQPTGLVLGARWDAETVGGVGTNQAKATASVATIEHIFPAGKDILVRTTTLANTNNFTAKFVMYEHELLAARP